MSDQDNIHNYPAVKSYLDGIGIKVQDLGCVMLPFEPIDLFGGRNATFFDESDLYYSDTSPYAQGDVTDKMHATLLYGLLEEAYSPTQRPAIDAVLAGWEKPEWIGTYRVEGWPMPNGEPAEAIVLILDDSDDELLWAHEQLSYLPHINTFPEYSPHVTLAYVKSEQADKWVEVLNQGERYILDVKQGELDYGEH